MHVRLSVILLLMSLPLSAAEPKIGPIIKGYGPTYPIEYRDVALEEGRLYKAVFDIAAYSDNTKSLNYRIESVARFLNMHGRNGVAVESMDLAIVVHGAAVKNLMTDTAYKKRFRRKNPNLEMLNALHEAGVKIYVCGQSMGFAEVSEDELADFVDVALSAMTMLTVLQNDGYALLR